MPNEHALLSPSAAERWISCPASIRLSERIPDEGSVYAQEGTIAHTRAELLASRAFGKMSEQQYSTALKEWRAAALEHVTEEQTVEMAEHAHGYVRFLTDRMAAHPGMEIMLERRVDTGIERCWGTGDAILFTSDHVEIVDFKYGVGVSVSAVENPQMKLYGLGALDLVTEFLGDPETVSLCIYQPRKDSVSVYDTTPDELRAWREEIRPRAAEALGDNAEFGPSEKACRWCPAAGVCRARMESVIEEDFGADPEILSNDELGDLLERIPQIKAFCSSVEAVTLHKAYSAGEVIPGWKVVRSGGRRRITDDEAAVDALVGAGFTAEQVSQRKARTLAQLEKLTKGALPDILGDLLAKSEGSPSMVREADPRPSINPASDAAADFADEED